MPPLGAELQAQQDYYRFQFQADGYPGRDDGWAHPLYGVYVLNDYLDQHDDDPTEELTQALATVAQATIDRMDEHRGALVFWYEADPDRGARLYRRHYSGLTQGYYASALYRVGERLDDPDLIDAAERVFASLTIPVEDGGVLHETRFGPVIAEVPQEPNSWILNGWQSALTSVHHYAELSGSAEAHRLVEDSAAAMAAMLPLYDVPELATSRYGLTGFTYLRINPAGAGVTLRDLSMIVPGEGSFDIPVEQGTRWQNYVFEQDATPVDGGVAISGSSARLNVVLSLSSAPTPNHLAFTFDADTAMDLVIEIRLGDYDPLSSAPVDTDWVKLSTVRAEPGQSLQVDVPVQMIERVAYPTNFIKELSGRHTNVYHTMHVRRLRQLAEITQNAELAVWSDRWEGYVCRWSDMAVYDGMAAARVVDPNHLQEPTAFCDPPTDHGGR